MSWTPKEAFADIARGDKAAEAFMGQFYCWVHKQDDLFDGDKPVAAETSVCFDLALLSAFAKNEFFQKHQDFLLPVLHMSALAWVASEDFRKKSEVLEQITAQVLKSQYQDIFYAVALLRGGFDHAVAMSRKYRMYSFDSKAPTEA
jgi:hypothetical protein